MLSAITLEHDSILQLVDDFDNAHRGGVGGYREAMYLYELTMLPGSTLDLNGKHLYVAELDYQGGDILNGDLISMIPGDANRNFCVDGADLALWQSNYDPIGPCMSGMPEVTPEPGTLLLLGTGILTLAGMVRRRSL